MTYSTTNSNQTTIAPSKKPRCSRCGSCCLKQGSGFTMTPADLRRWKEERREDILRYIPLRHIQALDHDVWIDWIDPETHACLPYCPFLRMVNRRTYICSINETKPDVCRGFWCEWAYGAGQRGKPFRPANEQV